MWSIPRVRARLGSSSHIILYVCGMCYTGLCRWECALSPIFLYFGTLAAVCVLLLGFEKKSNMHLHLQYPYKIHPHVTFFRWLSASLPVCCSRLVTLHHCISILRTSLSFFYFLFFVLSNVDWCIEFNNDFLIENTQRANAIAHATTMNGCRTTKKK